MVNRFETHANNVVSVFRNKLTANALAHINDADFDSLALLIQDAISAELSQTANQLERLVQELKSKHNKPELEL